MTSAWPLKGSDPFFDFGDAKISRPLLVGEYSLNEAFVFAINANWKFGRPPAPVAAEASSTK